MEAPTNHQINYYATKIK